MSGVILCQGRLTSKDGSVWPYDIVRWDAGGSHVAGEVTVGINPPDDPEHPLYGQYREMPEFSADQVVALAELIEAWKAQAS